MSWLSDTWHIVRRWASLPYGLGVRALSAVARRPLTASIFLVSLSLLMIVPLFAYRYYTITDAVRSYVEVQPSTGLSARLVRVEADYVPGPTDRLSVSVWLNSNTAPPAMSATSADLILTVSRRLTTAQTLGNCVKLYNELEYEDVRWLYYRLKRSSECRGTAVALSQQFTGNLFRASHQDLWLDLLVVVKQEQAVVETFVFGMTGVAIETAFPEPTERAPQYLLYRWSPQPRSSDEWQRIIVRGLDRRLASRATVILFGSGVLCGVLASMVAAVSLDVARGWENRRERSRASLQTGTRDSISL